MSRCQRILGPVVAVAAAGAGLVAVAPPAHAASLRVSPTANLAPGGQQVTVAGSGFDAARNNGFGVYVVFGPRRGDFHRNANAFASAVWVHRGGSGAGQARMSAAGTFTVTLRVKAKYTDGDGRAVDCAATGCYVMAFAAHGVPDRSQDAFVPVSFRASRPSGGTAPGGGASSPAAAPSGRTTAAPNTTASTAASSSPTAAGAAPQASPAGSATPLAVEPYRVTAAGAPARSPWPFWLAVGAVAAAALAVRRLARRR
ncbi:hypothetical protein HUT06_31990 [Actinomadura sp. NAK00032]|uniref:hypothetical protein n=1 Tax=Actinomadura sp. NAK00032 TaxID=2742128 RepID=UPI00159059C6|nr:hypothetical protein [Actinomadura sp. NAK00032]QKW38054.1 hypothetical protein HUT06_31990 [Actinomadura sp. NAK00032]